MTRTPVPNGASHNEATAGDAPREERHLTPFASSMDRAVGTNPQGGEGVEAAPTPAPSVDTGMGFVPPSAVIEGVSFYAAPELVQAPVRGGQGAAPTAWTSDPRQEAAEAAGEGLSFTGRALLRALGTRSLSQKALAEALDVSPAYVSAVVRGKKAVSAPTVEKMAAALSLAPEESRALHRAAARDQGFRLDLPEDW